MPIQDDFEGRAVDAADPLNGAFAITPDDGADLAAMPRALMVATAGDVAVTMRDGTSVTLPALSPGAVYPVRPRRVLATGTTATGLVGLY